MWQISLKMVYSNWCFSNINFISTLLLCSYFGCDPLNALQLAVIDMRSVFFFQFLVLVMYIKLLAASHFLMFLATCTVKEQLTHSKRTQMQTLCTPFRVINVVDIYCVRVEASFFCFVSHFRFLCFNLSFYTVNRMRQNLEY